jgi:hypothetical protein
MSTRCYIGLKDKDSVRAIYSHSDGYPAYVGKILLENYNTPEKINQLLDLGALSLLNTEIGEKHNFHDMSHPTWCRAYNRDRDDPKEHTEAQEFLCEAEFLMSCKEDYTYLFKDGQWHYRSWSKSLIPLTHVV